MNSLSRLGRSAPSITRSSASASGETSRSPVSAGNSGRLAAGHARLSFRSAARSIAAASGLLGSRCGISRAVLGGRIRG